MALRFIVADDVAESVVKNGTIRVFGLSLSAVTRY